MTYYVSVSKSIYPAYNLIELRSLLQDLPSAQVFDSNAQQIDLKRFDLQTGKYTNKKNRK